MTDKLKPCPFCGSKDVEIYTIGHDDCVIDDGYIIECNNCEVHTKECETEKAVIELWNMRN